MTGVARMRRLTWAFKLGVAGLVGSTVALTVAAFTRNLELALLSSEVFLASLGTVLTALAFIWLARAKRIQDKCDALDQERSKYYAARAVLDVEAERALHASEASARHARETIERERAALQQEYEAKLAASQAEMDQTRVDECKKAWLLGIDHERRGLVEEPLDTSRTVIPWPVTPPRDDTAKGAGGYGN
jgi:hypothetical protein